MGAGMGEAGMCEPRRLACQARGWQPSARAG